MKFSRCQPIEIHFISWAEIWTRITPKNAAPSETMKWLILYNICSRKRICRASSSQVSMTRGNWIIVYGPRKRVLWSIFLFNVIINNLVRVHHGKYLDGIKGFESILCLLFVLDFLQDKKNKKIARKLKIINQYFFCKINGQ